MPSFVEFEFVGERRARSDQTHIAANHVDDLRQLIDTVATHDPSDPGDSIVVGELENFLAVRGGAVGGGTLALANPLLDVLAMRIVTRSATHGAKFEKVELLAM